MYQLSDKDKERFWSKVYIAGPDECWEWQAQRISFGYGRFQLNGSAESAHRIAYDLIKGIKDPSSVIQHECDNTSCVNPAHLLEGTQSDNIQSCSDRGRHVGNRKLNDEAVKVIKWMLKHKNRYGLITKLADLHGVSREAIKSIKSGKAWSHVEVP